MKSSGDRPRALSISHCLRRWYKGCLMVMRGWRSGESTRLSPMRPGFNSRTWRHKWVEFVVVSHPFSEGFFSGFSGFPPFIQFLFIFIQCHREELSRFTDLGSWASKVISESSKSLAYSLVHPELLKILFPFSEQNNHHDYRDLRRPVS